MADSIRYQIRDRVLEIDDAVRARAAAAGCDPIEHRLWEAGFSREAAQRTAQEIRSQEKPNAVDEPRAT